jgi:hypothetical protein
MPDKQNISAAVIVKHGQSNADTVLSLVLQ